MKPEGPMPLIIQHNVIWASAMGKCKCSANKSQTSKRRKRRINRRKPLENINYKINETGPLVKQKDYFATRLMIFAIW